MRLLFAVEMVMQNTLDQGGHFAAQLGHNAFDDDVFDVLTGFVNQLIGQGQALRAERRFEFDEIIGRRPGGQGIGRANGFGQDRQVIVFVGLCAD